MIASLFLEVKECSQDLRLYHVQWFCGNKFDNAFFFREPPLCVYSEDVWCIFWSLYSWYAWPSSFIPSPGSHFIFTIKELCGTSSHDVFPGLKQVILDVLKKLKIFKLDLLFVTVSSCLLQSCSVAYSTTEELWDWNCALLETCSE